MLRVLGVQASLHGVAAQPHRGLVEAERLPGGDPELVGDQVPPGHRLGHRVLDLEPRVHLQEEEPAVIGQEELDRARPDVPGGSGHAQGGGAHGRAQPGTDRWRGGLLQDLLLPPLGAAVTLGQVHAMTVGVEEDLDFDVASRFEQALEDEPIVAERGHRLAAAGRQRLRKLLRGAYHPHALATTPGGRLHQQREADLPRGVDERGVALGRVVVARYDRHSVGCSQASGGRLVAEGVDGGRRWTDPGQPGGADRLGERRVFGQEAVPRVNRVGSG